MRGHSYHRRRRMSSPAPRRVRQADTVHAGLSPVGHVVIDDVRNIVHIRPACGPSESPPQKRLPTRQEKEPFRQLHCRVSGHTRFQLVFLMGCSWNHVGFRVRTGAGLVPERTWNGSDSHVVKRGRFEFGSWSRPPALPHRQQSEPEQAQRGRLRHGLVLYQERGRGSRRCGRQRIIAPFAPPVHLWGHI